MNVTKWNPKHLLLAPLLLPFVLGGCAFWHTHVSSPRPRFTLRPAVPLLYRLDCATNWMLANSISNDVQDWYRHYTNAISIMFPWAPDHERLSGTFTDAFSEYGQSDPAYAGVVTNQAKAFLDAYFQCPPASGANMLNKSARRMLELADRENRNLFDKNLEHVGRRFSSKGCLPQMTSPDLPVGVSVTPSWNETPTASAPNPSPDVSKTNKQQIALGKLILTLEPAAAPPNESSSTERGEKDNRMPDFHSDQTVDLSISTILNSASTLDRIDSVSTYVYLYPWPMILNGDAVPEREFWERFFARNALRDASMRTNDYAIQSDFLDAIEGLRVKAHDLSTMVDLGQVDLGSIQQVFGHSVTEGVTASGGVPPFSSINPQISATQSAIATASSSPKQQIDQRSTYIDESGDFFRINQRGMQSLDLAGRFKTKLTLHVPTASKQINVLIPPKGINDWYELQALTLPLYRGVDALTFSVAVTHQTTSLSANTEDRYGLSDRNDATLIVGVTLPQHIRLWNWERAVTFLCDWDIFGKTNTPAKQLYFTTFEGEQPSPLCLGSTFDDALTRKLISNIRQSITRTNGFAVLKIAEGTMTIGYADTNPPTRLIKIVP